MRDTLNALFDHVGFELPTKRKARKTAKVVTARDVERRARRKPITPALLTAYHKARATAIRRDIKTATAQKLASRGVPIEIIAKRLRLRTAT